MAAAPPGGRTHWRTNYGEGWVSVPRRGSPIGVGEDGGWGDAAEVVVEVVWGFRVAQRLPRAPTRDARTVGCSTAWFPDRGRG